MASVTVAATQANAEKFGKLAENVEYYKEIMRKSKNTLVQERGGGGELKRKHEATLSEFKRFQKAYHVLELEKDALVLSTTITEGENKYFENKISKLEVQKDATDKQAEELNCRVVEPEAQNNSLEIQLMAANEGQFDITPF